jgi:hypothetical protein
MKKILAFAIFGSIVAAPAAAESFSRDGYTYSYTTKAVGEATIISGKVAETGESFRLRVKGNRVVGRVGVNSVSFRTADASVAGAKGGSAVFAAK